MREAIINELIAEEQAVKEWVLPEPSSQRKPPNL